MCNGKEQGEFRSCRKHGKKNRSAAARSGGSGSAERFPGHSGVQAAARATPTGIRRKPLRSTPAPSRAAPGPCLGAHLCSESAPCVFRMPSERVVSSPDLPPGALASCWESRFSGDALRVAGRGPTCPPRRCPRLIVSALFLFDEPQFPRP